MRRISLALALSGAMAATGCGGGAKSSSSGGAQGTVGKTFTVTVQNGQNGNAGLAIVGGKVTSSPAGIDCGVGTTQVCSFDFDVNTPVVLTATPSGTDASVNLPYLFLGWAGDCSGETTCSLSGNSSKYVLAMFGGTRTGHPNWSDPALHGPEAMTSSTYNCATCHGAQLQGAGIAPSCSKCHNAPASTTGLQVTVTGVSVDQTAQTFTVNFSLKDDQGKPVDIKGVYSQNALMSLRVALARIDTAADGQVLPYAVLTPASGSPGTLTMPAVGATSTAGTLTEVGTNAGTYAFTSAVMPKISTTNLASTHTLWIQATRQTDLADANDVKGFKAVNFQYNFTGSTGTASTTKREVASNAGCSKCHAGFKPDVSVANGFHGSARVDANFCDVCHNPARTSNPIANAMVFVHRIHAAEQLSMPTTAIFDNTTATYPQDVRNCKQCHAGAAQGDQYKTRPTAAACGSCHYAIDFVAGTGHAGGPQSDDSACAGCHTAASIDTAHVPVAPPDATNCLAANNAAGCNNNTNAGYLPAAGADVSLLGATAITYEIKSVGLDSNGKPTMTFRLLKNGTPAAIDNCPEAAATPAAGTGELFTGFVGAPSIYFVFAVPEDGISAPVDFNGSASAYLKAACLAGVSAYSATAVPTTMSGPDASQYYTLTITGASNLSSVKMLTGGVGYTYGLTSTQPLTEVDLTGTLAATDMALTAGKYNNVSCTAAAPCNVKLGGLVNVAPNQKMVATGFTGRRTIVDNAKCKNCHAALGAEPTFHAGNRNDGESCIWCHNPNQNNNGWAGNAKDFIHGLHAGTIAGVTLPDGTTSTRTGVRTVPFGWHAVSATDGYWGVELPGQHNNCEACHTPNGYDFSATTSANNMLFSTAATGTPAAGPSLSPYVTAGTVYGAGFSFNSSTGVTTAPAATTLVTSPIAAACLGCHDDSTTKAHITAKGGQIYQPRSTANISATSAELCLGCHGAGATFSISVMHKQ
ncbi:OmcA/MtrC family decaheme c-type cytochrome [Anaeromyxobacter oryzae]|uniref:Outer membrane cytochrome MtrC/MtrF-like domain-containing protein n=1 Tax=Anaeromyxobacter oryzae TaxID=2918170 RepID=A0ABM7X0B5_9BACT|nr:OmcA/MtrC family decaheme c-type cytochrome [Anaeromyxobacter oryzae]BDG05240.1 hypothetical protein AMOR_42360 [Anaeromyxobacter oryzae]